MISPWSIAAALSLWAASIVAAGMWAFGAGRDAETATQAREDRAAQLATDAAARAAAAAIARIKVQHSTITAEVQREIVDRPVYRDCSHSPDQLQRLNAALTAGQPPADDQLPAPHPPR